METNQELPTRQSLLSRLKDWNDDPSWQDFFNTYWRLIVNTGISAGLTLDEAEEVAQETLISVSKSIRTFRYDRQQGTFKAWLRTITIFRIRDRLRSHKRRRTEPLEVVDSRAELETCADPAEDPISRNWDVDWEKNLLIAATERVKQKVDPKHFQVFDLAVVKEWPPAKIARALGLSPGYVYLLKHRISARIRSELKKLRKDPCQASQLLTVADRARPTSAP